MLLSIALARHTTFKQNKKSENEVQFHNIGQQIDLCNKHHFITYFPP